MELCSDRENCLTKTNNFIYRILNSISDVALMIQLHPGGVS